LRDDVYTLNDVRFFVTTVPGCW